MWWNRKTAVWSVIGFVQVFLLSNASGTVASPAQPPNQLIFTSVGQGRFKLTNQTPRSLKVQLSPMSDKLTGIRIETLTNGKCNNDPKVIDNVDLGPGESRCVWVKASLSRKPVFSATTFIVAESVGGDNLRAETATKLVVPVSRELPASPSTTVETGLFATWDVLPACEPLSFPVSYIHAQGNELRACVTPLGQLVGLLSAPAQPGIYTNDTAFTVKNAPALATITVRRPWWYAAFFILLGLLLPALLRFIADRHREKEALKLAVAEEGLQVGDPAFGIPAIVEPFQLSLPPGLVNPNFTLPVLQPFSDVRLACQALLEWRHLTGSREILKRLLDSQKILSRQLGAGTYLPSWATSPSHLLVFLGEVSSGVRLELFKENQTSNYQVPLSRAADVVASLEAARRLARTVERLDLPRIQAKLPAASSVKQAAQKAVQALHAGPVPLPQFHSDVRNAQTDLTTTTRILDLFNAGPAGLDPATINALRRQLVEVTASVERALSSATRIGLPVIQTPFFAQVQQATEAILQLPGDTDERRVPFLLLERLIFEVAPVSASAKDINAYTERVVELGDAALSSVLGAEIAPVPGNVADSADSDFATVSLASPGRDLLQANAAVRWFTLPLLMLALAVAVAVGINGIWDKPGAWGERGWLDYGAAVGVGIAAFLAAGLVQSTVSLLGGSALIPGLLRKLPGAAS
jgi:hypothetical protein